MRRSLSRGGEGSGGRPIPDLLIGARLRRAPSRKRSSAQSAAILSDGQNIYRSIILILDQ
jgi:hypothetical protein